MNVHHHHEQQESINNGVPRDDALIRANSRVERVRTLTEDWLQENADQGNSHEQSLEQEIKRLVALKSFMALDRDAEKAREATFDELTDLASRTLGVQMCLCTLVDLGRICLLSNLGLDDVKRGSGKDTFFAHAILSKDDVFIVPDATKDKRFSASPLVTAPNGVRFYAAVPLHSPEGYTLGWYVEE
jgi:hypothetical protein